jgi:hypothetical protein
MMRFSYEERVDPSFIVVDMRWVDGEREGEVQVPVAMRKVLRDNDYPLPDGVQRLEFAVSYGVCVALLSRKTLRLTGDPSVWDPAWGALHFPKGPQH